MATKGQMTGMQGVYLAAAELTYRGLIVSVTSRNARGADLLATDQSYKKTWSIQVKTNAKSTKWWLLNKDYKHEVAPNHVYIFINLKGVERPDYYIVPSLHVARRGKRIPRPNSVFFAYNRDIGARYRENWSIFTSRLSSRGGPRAPQFRWQVLRTLGSVEAADEKAALAEAAKESNIEPARRSKIVVTRLDQKRED
jgi:hypothetical protein